MGIVQNYGGLLATRLCLGIAGMIVKYPEERDTTLTISYRGRSVPWCCLLHYSVVPSPPRSIPTSHVLQRRQYRRCILWTSGLWYRCKLFVL